MKCWPFSYLRSRASPHGLDTQFDSIPWNDLNIKLEVAQKAVDAIPDQNIKQALGMFATELVPLTSQSQVTLGLMKDHFNRLLENIAACKGCFINMSAEAKLDIATLIADLNDAATKLRKITSHGWLYRFIYRGILDQDDGLVAIQDKIRHWSSWFLDIKHKAEAAIDKLPLAPAQYDSGWRSGVSGCHDGTRLALLEEIDEWATGGADTLRIFWLNGLAGTGKSSVAYTVAEVCQKNQHLGASFFFSRSKAQCTEGLLFFSTIAHQIASFDVEHKMAIAKAIVETKRLEDIQIRVQLLDLIINPLRSLGSQHAPLVIVVDALDECSSPQDIAEILHLIAHEAQAVPFLRFLITSRPENYIQRCFDTFVTPISKTLHEIKEEIVRSDIQLYLDSKLPLLGPHIPWPTPSEISQLVHNAAGFFIFAATVVKFLEGDKEKAQNRLDILLRKQDARYKSPYPDLDILYFNILHAALPQTARRDLKRLFQQIVSTIVLLFDPISLPALEKLLNLEPGDAKPALAGLHSVIIVPTSINEGARTWHPSFRDFLTDKQRCIGSNGKPDPRFYIDSSQHHRRIAISCLNLLMSSLQSDICNIQDYSKSNDEVEDLQQRINDKIPSHLQYSCIHWTSHVLQATPTGELAPLLLKFFRKYLLYWLEALSLINKLEIAAKDLLRVKRWYLPTDELSSLVHDAQRFTLLFYDAIGKSALSVYQSALLFTPRNTALFKTYGDKMVMSVGIAGDVEEQWNPCLRVLEHYSNVLSVASSPDGQRLVSGAEDKLVRVWDREAGTLIAELKEHAGAVKCVVFSGDRDGVQIASGSVDGAIRVWDAKTYTCTAVLHGHSKGVTSIAFFQSGAQVISGSEDTTIRIWSPPQQEPIYVLHGHDLGVTGVACCPHDLYVASGSRDNTVRMWDANSGALIHKWDVKAEVNCVAFSADGARIAAGSQNHKVLIWDVKTYEKLDILHGHTHFVFSIAFSRDGNRVFTGSYDSIVQVFDVTDVRNGRLISTLRGHSDAVVSVAICHDPSIILSGSHDKSVRIWDIGATHTTTNGHRHTSMINSVAFSPDGCHIVTTSDDSTARVWDHTMQPLAILRHSNLVLDAKFFPHGSRIITGSHDETVGVWEANGQRLTSLKGHIDSIRCISVSPSGKYIAAGSGDKTARIWDATSYAFVVELKGHLNWVTAVAFSPDDHLVATGSKDCKVRVWDFPSGVSLKVLDGQRGDPFVDVAFSSGNGRAIIISRSTSHKLITWDAKTRKPDQAPSIDEADMLITNLSGAYGEPLVVENHGWVILRQRDVRRRICWIPPTWRGLHTIAFHSRRIAIGSGMGDVAILELRDTDVIEAAE